MTSTLIKIGVYEVIYHGFMHESQYTGFTLKGRGFTNIVTVKERTLEGVIDELLNGVEENGYDVAKLRDEFYKTEFKDLLVDPCDPPAEEDITEHHYHYLTIIWS